ncbi:LysR family transcriptional regulator [Mesorhizobium sp. M1329]|uniref:LysR family transcriptional regulator n=1 Tax=unclassified Mesorhizobium TaxID=325217 RepID=UPI003338A1E0
MFDLEVLSTFVEVADAGGVSAAARRLGLPKSIVSRRLQRLEQDLGTQLLVRTTRGAALTEAGATLREHAVRAISELEAARDSVSPEGDVRGRLRIAAPLSFGVTHLCSVLAELASRHPRLHVHTAYSDRFVDLVGEGFDVGIRVGILADSNLIARRIAPLRGTCVASPAYLAKHGTPMTPDDLAQHECLLQGNETWRFVVSGKTISISPRGRFKADNGTALLRAALAGLGIAALPDFLADVPIAEGTLRQVMADYPPPEAGIYVVRPPGGTAPRKVRALIDILIERFGAR